MELKQSQLGKANNVIIEIMNFQSEWTADDSKQPACHRGSSPVDLLVLLNSNLLWNFRSGLDISARRSGTRCSQTAARMRVVAHLWSINRKIQLHHPNSFIVQRCKIAARTYMTLWSIVARDCSFRCNNLCARRLRDTFPYRRTASPPSSNKSVSIACTGGRGRQAMRTLHPAANNCLSMPFGPQWKQLWRPSNPVNVSTMSLQPLLMH